MRLADAQAPAFAPLAALVVDPVFAGTKTDLAVDAGTLTLADPAAPGLYAFAAGLDFGSPRAIRLRPEIRLSAIAIGTGIEVRITGRLVSTVHLRWLRLSADGGQSFFATPGQYDAVVTSPKNNNAQASAFSRHHSVDLTDFLGCATAPSLLTRSIGLTAQCGFKLRG